MKLRFQHSGGFAGLVRGCELSGADLPPPLAALAAELAREQPRAAPPDPAVRDDLLYDLTIEEAGTKVELHLAPADLPEHFAPLITHLVSSSRPQPLR